jgi:glycolate oxidase
MDTAKQLTSALGKSKVILSAKSAFYSKDKSHLPGQLPLAVVLPTNSSDISKIATICNKNKTKMVVRGGGSSLTGASIPLKGGIVIDMSRFNRILETHIEDEYVVVEPGITIDKLNEHLSKYNYFYPPNPASSAFASIGGTIATNAGGLRAIMYGTTKEWVLGLEVVLPSGQIIRTGTKTTKRSIGYDLTALIVGSEGTLGIVTKAILKIWPKPDATGRIISYYSKIEDAASAVVALKKKGIMPLSAEFMDSKSMQLMHQYMGITFLKESKYFMIIDLAESKESLDRFLAQSERIFFSCDAIRVKLSKSKDGMERMNEARKYLYIATVNKAEKEGKSVIIADVVVPSSELPATLHEIEKEISNQNLEVVLFGHIGDGNIHGNIIADSKKDAIQIDKLQTIFGHIALKHRGSVSGEHGIGLTKKKLLIEEMKSRKSEYSIELMRKIKKEFDPNGILNPGKIFD